LEKNHIQKAETNVEKVVCYLRTSSASNLDGDSETRQKEAIASYAEKNSLEIVDGAYDQAVSGTDPVMFRKGIKKIIELCAEEGIHIILCENASRFARDLIVQEQGYLELKARNLQIVPVDAPDYFTGEDASKNLIRQMLGSVSQFEKSNLVYKLREARQRVSLEKGKCEGRKSMEEIWGTSEFRKLVKLVLKLSDQGNSYAKIAVILAERGWLQPSKGKPFHKSQIMRLIKKGRGGV